MTTAAPFRQLLDTHGVQEVCELRSRVGFMAYHGGSLEEVTDVTTGAVVSITMALFAPSDPAAPGVGSVSVAKLVARSVIVPANDVALT